MFWGKSRENHFINPMRNLNVDRNIFVSSSSVSAAAETAECNSVSMQLAELLAVTSVYYCVELVHVADAMVGFAAESGNSLNMIVAHTIDFVWIIENNTYLKSVVNTDMQTVVPSSK